MIRYIHGSGDSTDVDVMYVTDKLPSKIECKEFCSADPSENRNLCVCSNGVVTDCYKGTPDEINNSLLATYRLHEQEWPLIVTHKVERDLTIKIVRSVRIILSHISRSQYRTRVKNALISEFPVRIETLRSIDLSTIDFSTINKKMTREDVLKTIAFQLGQTVALMDGIEVYTKKSISEIYPALTDFLYRKKDSDIKRLDDFKNIYLNRIEQLITSNSFTVTDGRTTYEVIKEEKIC